MCSLHEDEDDQSPAAIRQELIQRIKNGERFAVTSDSKFAHLFDRIRESEEASNGNAHGPPKLLPPADVREASGPVRPSQTNEDERSSSLNCSSSKPQQRWLRFTEDGSDHPGSEIERPRSALHAGDFDQPPSQPPKPACCHQGSSHALKSTQNASTQDDSPPQSWLLSLAKRRSSSPQKDTLDPPRKTVPLSISRRFDEASHQDQPLPPSPVAIPASTSQGSTRSRAPSLQSFSSSFVLKTPTSPLVRETKHDDDLEPSSLDLSGSPSKATRRHTFSPQAFQTLSSRSWRNFSTPAQVARQPPTPYRDGPATSHGHYARRSLSGIPYQASSTPQTPNFPASRRTFFSSEASPSLRATLVGSYEESILRGRMSSAPSKPFDFTAQIGALGRSDCKPKHPPHVSVDFPAVYYNWNAGPDRPGFTDNEPSPYVGFIDLEHKLPPHQCKRRKRHEPPTKVEAPDSTDELTSVTSTKREKRRHRSVSPEKGIPAGGSYRIPQQGQLQILIKSPNKTAVKLFLVPYDLSGMEPGTKTFVRQRCYSTGPVIEKPLSSKAVNSSTSEPLVSAKKDKASLRYLIQFNICCPSKGRFFLYKSIQVVFANRVPDNKEGLRNELLWPDPKYTPYRPADKSAPPSPALRPQSSLRRRSYGGPTPLAPSDAFAPTDGFDFGFGGPLTAGPNASVVPPVPPLPFAFAARKRTSSRLSAAVDRPDPTSPSTDSQGTRETTRSPRPLSTRGGGSDGDNCSDGDGNGSGGDIFSKRSRDDDRYGGVFGRPGTPEPGEGLLARRFREFDLEAARKRQDGPPGMF